MSNVAEGVLYIINYTPPHVTEATCDSFSQQILHLIGAKQLHYSNT